MQSRQWPEAGSSKSHFGVWVAGKKKKQLLRINVKRFREGLVFKAHRLLFHSTLGWRVINKKNFGWRGRRRRRAGPASGSPAVRVYGRWCATICWGGGDTRRWGVGVLAVGGDLEATLAMGCCFGCHMVDYEGFVASNFGGFRD